jgi:hypothetical protein
MTMKKLVILLALFNLTVGAQESHIETIVDSVKYLENTQVKIDDAPNKFLGEWPSYMMAENDVILLGYAGKKAYDSNLFTTASIHNSLATAYLKHPEKLAQIPNMLETAMENILYYKSKDTDTFGFWPNLPLPDEYKTKKERRKNIYVETRRPNHFLLDSVFINNASNVPDDADDTAVSYVAMKLNQKVAEVAGNKAPEIKLEKIGPLFSQYRDTLGKRRSMHYYNVLHGANIYTGAFLTWLQKEKIFTPWSWAPTSHKERYIPYESNEVDCVVNANVLNALATFDELDTKGVEKACKFIKKSFKKEKRTNLCGLYYPNHFHLHYVTAKALKAGATCLEDVKDKIIEDIVSRQLKDGSLQSKPKKDSNLSKKIIGLINKGENFRRKKNRNKQEQETKWVEELDPYDTLQSTIYAGLALSYLIDESNPEQVNSLNQIKNYVLNNKIQDELGTYWKGGVFFAGGTLVRNDLKWRSNAYTTGLVIELLSNMENK